MKSPLAIEQFPAWIGKVGRAVLTPDLVLALNEWLAGFLQTIAAGFEQSHSPFGQDWAPLKHPRSAGHNPNSRPLIDTGALERSVSAAGCSGSIFEIRPDGLTFGTSLPGASAHQDSRRSWLPQRPFLNVNQEQTDRAEQLFAQAIVRAFAA